MAKLITSRFASRCKKCGQAIRVGERVYWEKGHGSWHVKCANSETTDPNVPPTDSSPNVQATAVKPVDSSVTIPWNELRETYSRLVHTERSDFNRSVNRKLAEGYVPRWKSGETWMGCTAGEMQQYFQSGFPVAGLSGINPGLLPDRSRRKLKFDEDGDIDVDLALSGFDYPFLAWEKRQSRPGIAIEIPVSFNADISAKVISDYQRWVARAIYTLEDAGYDAEIFLTMRTTNSYKGTGVKPRNETRIQVKLANEASDFANYSAMFSPGGFRHLGFLGIISTGDKLGLDTQSSLGSAVYDKDWRVTYSEDTRTIRFSSPQSREFPEAEMTAQLGAILNHLEG